MNRRVDRGAFGTGHSGEPSRGERPSRRERCRPDDLTAQCLRHFDRNGACYEIGGSPGRIPEYQEIGLSDCAKTVFAMSAHPAAIATFEHCLRLMLFPLKNLLVIYG